MRADRHPARSLCVLGATAALIAAAGAAAQNTCYRVVDAADLGSLPVGDRQVPGINPSGEIVGSYYVDGQWHAFLWLPDENPNYPDSRLSVGLNDLHVLADNGQGLGPGDSAARDINSAGKVVGQAGVLDLETVGGRAFILDLTQEGIPLIPMAIPNPTQSHGAWAVNDASPYQVVGHYTSTATCPPNPALLLRRGFVWQDSVSTRQHRVRHQSWSATGTAVAPSLRVPF
jgi:hypothetical protein